MKALDANSASKTGAKRALWSVTLRRISGGNTGAEKVILMPSGLSEAEAGRCAVLKAGTGWKILSVVRALDS